MKSRIQVFILTPSIRCRPKDEIYWFQQTKLYKLERRKVTTKKGGAGPKRFIRWLFLVIHVNVYYAYNPHCTILLNLRKFLCNNFKESFHLQQENTKFYAFALGEKRQRTSCLSTYSKG